MTFDERRLLKAAVSEARQARERLFAEERGERLCDYCHQPYRFVHVTQRFCSKQHKGYAWASQTPQGRLWRNAKQNRRRQAKRLAA